MRVKKWFLRILLVALILPLLLLAAVQVVLWTDLPKNWVISALQEKLQLRVSAASFSTGWSGRTSLSNVTLSLPLAQESFLQAPRVSIGHTNLLALLIGRPLRVEAIEIDRPNLLVRQQANGRWNIEDVAELIRRASGGKTAETQPQPSMIPQLPKVTITDGTVRLIDVAGRQATLSPLAVVGEPNGPLVWKYDASVPNQIRLSGEVAPGGKWQHIASIDVKRIGPIVRPFFNHPSPALQNTIETFHLNGQWNGRVEGTLQGRLDLKDFFLGGYTATGPLNLMFDQGTDTIATLVPAGTTINPPPSQNVPPARVAAGVISFDGKSATAKDVALAFAGGEVRIGGSYAWSGGQGKLDAWWNKLILPEGTQHSGSLTASIRQPWPNQPVINLSLTTDGKRGVDTWNGKLTLDGAGPAWDQINWILAAPKLTYDRAGQSYNLDNLSARISTRGDLTTLDSLAIPPGPLYGKWQRGTLEGRGRYDKTSGNWNVYLSGAGWPVSPNAKTPADFSINAYGDRAWARLQEFSIHGGGMEVWADGDISFMAQGKPVDLNVYAWYPPVDYTWHEKDGDRRDDVRFAGNLWSELHVSKQAWPINLDIKGTLYAKDFRVKDHPLGDVAINLDGAADRDHVHIATSRLELLSGAWGITADHNYRRHLTRMDVSLREMSLAQLDNFIGPPPNLRGTFNGQWSIGLPRLDVNRAEVSGEYTIRNLGRFAPPPPTSAPAEVAALDKPGVESSAALQASLVTAPERSKGTYTVVRPVTLPVPTAATASTTQVAVVPIADEISGKIIAKGGTVTLDPIDLKRKDGRGQAKLSFPITSPRQMQLGFSVAAWPLDFVDTRDRSPGNVQLWAQSNKIDIDLRQLTANGPLNLRAIIGLHKRTITVDVDSQVNQRRLDLKSIQGKGLGGHIEGDGYIDLDSPLQSAGRVNWEGVDATAVAAVLPITQGLSGRYSGSARFSPTDRTVDPDATGPFAVSGNIRSESGNFKGIQIGDASFLAHADFQRAVLDRLDWDLAGGNLKAWSRVTRYDADPFVHVKLNFDKISLDQIVRAARPPGQVHKPVPGLISGTAFAAGSRFSPERRRDASGELHVRLADSDLVNVPTVNFLYSVLSVQFGPPVPRGKGFIDARLEGTRLEVPAIRYVNRGVDIWANLTVLDVFKGVDSPIQGTAGGSARPLKDLKLPFMADVDQMLKALQGAIAVVQIEGTIRDPRNHAIPFSESGDTFRRFMLGEVKNEVRGTAGR
jgi:uncharacterized protein involved in outer membrane biogenesis